MRYFLFAALLLSIASTTGAAQIMIDGPVGSGLFGSRVTVLPNGNFVVTDPNFDGPDGALDVGAVYLYRPTGELLSTLRGSSTGDEVGLGGVTVLANGNYVVLSPNWDNGNAIGAGAVTFGSATSGANGVVSPGNSLVGTLGSDVVGSDGVTALANGSYVVRSPNWDNGTIINAGALTFGSGTTGISGNVSVGNSLVGSSADDRVGASKVTALTNGNYVVIIPFWDNGTATDAGAVTFGSGSAGISGPISATNSLVGTTANDQLGSDGVTALTNGNYVVLSPRWDNGQIVSAGAATFGSGSLGAKGVVSAANSLVGTAASRGVGSGGSVVALTNGNYVVRSPGWSAGPIANVGAVTFGSGTLGVSGVISESNSLVGTVDADQIGARVIALANGNYVVVSTFWNNGTIESAGAVTFGSGVTGIHGVVSAANSLVGSSAFDRVGSSSVTALANGNYVVASEDWDDGPTVNAGAATFGSGTTGISGIVSVGNSLVGSTTDDFLGATVTALANGNFVVTSPGWENGLVVNAGAATFGSGSTGISGVISEANSLVGSRTGDNVGSNRVTALTNGNYVVNSPNWDNGTTTNAGAVTFGSGDTGISGVVSEANSLVGRIAIDGVVALSNGNYVVSKPNWRDGPTLNVGAVTFGSGITGISGIVSASNSLVGSIASDLVGSGGTTALANGSYVVRSNDWDNGAIGNGGAITLALADGSVTGPITTTHSVLGMVQGLGSTQVFSYDAVRNQLVVGQPFSRRVVLHRTGVATAISIVGDSPDPSSDGQPVTFTATVSGEGSGPADGQVRFTASNGDTCVDSSPTTSSPLTTDYSCAIVFSTGRLVSVIAEYTGSVLHAYSGSAPELHFANIGDPFRDGFENP